MRTFYILAAICIVGTYAKYSDYQTEFEKCAEESDVSSENVGFDFVYKIKAGVLKPSEELYCFTACLFKKLKEADGTIHDKVMQVIAHADEKRGFFDNKPYTREDFDNVANKCAHKELSDCDYLKCVKMLEPPFVNLP